MPDWGDALRELAGGFAAVRRIDTEGFDWREKAAQEEFLRQRQREQARQADEDRMIQQLTDVLATEEGEPDAAAIESLIPAEVDKARKSFMAKVALGQLPERKSRIESAKAGAAYNKQLLAGEQQQELARLRADLAEGRQLSPAEQARLDALERMNEKRIGASNARFYEGQNRADSRAQMRDDRYYTKIPGENEGQAGTWYINRGTNEREFFPAGPTSTSRQRVESRGAAMDVFNNLMQFYDATGGQPEGGISARVGGVLRRGQAAIGENPEARTYLSGVRGFVPLLARALGHSGVLTELDVQRTESLFPQLGDTKEEARQKRQILQDIMLGKRPMPFQFEGQSEAEEQAPPSPTRPSVGKPRERMVKYKGKLVPLSSLPPELQALVK